MKKYLSDKILREYVKYDDVNSDTPISILPLTVTDAMEEYGAIVSKKICISFYKWTETDNKAWDMIHAKGDSIEKVYEYYIDNVYKENHEEK